MYVTFNQYYQAKCSLLRMQLAAFVMGDLEYVETTNFRIPVRVYTTPGLAASGRFALELAAKTLKFYEDSFDSPFPLPKMDMVA
jgi:aminopeptidase 2